MKTKIFKIGMPIMVFMLAIVFAFATENKVINADEAFIQGYIYQNNDCVSTDMECNNVGAQPCTIGGKQVYELDLGTFCDNPLTHRLW